MQIYLSFLILVLSISITEAKLESIEDRPRLNIVRDANVTQAAESNA
jgi:hypothetical protein